MERRSTKTIFIHLFILDDYNRPKKVSWKVIERVKLQVLIHLEYVEYVQNIYPNEALSFAVKLRSIYVIHVFPSALSFEVDY